MSSDLYAIVPCECCGQPLAAGESSRGLLVFSRGGEPMYEEPPLCASCGVAIGVTAMVRWAEEEEEG